MRQGAISRGEGKKAREEFEVLKNKVTCGLQMEIKEKTIGGGNEGVPGAGVVKALDWGRENRE